MVDKSIDAKNDIVLKRSIVSIINSFIHNEEKKALDINFYSNFFSLKIYGSMDGNIEHDNNLIKSLNNLSEQVYYVTTIKGVKTTKIFDFHECESGMYKIKDVSVLSSPEKTDSKSFIIYKSNYKDTLKALNIEENRQDLKTYINDIYNEAFYYLKIRCFDEILLYKEKQGILLNDEYSIFSDKVKIEVYKMIDNYKSCDIFIDGIKADSSIIKQIINWNKYPFRQKGYSFRKLNILIHVKEDSFEMSDTKKIENLYKEQEDNVIKLIESYKEHFRNSKMYYNLEYDKGKMQKIIEVSKCKNVFDAVKFILDRFYKENCTTDKDNL